MWDFDHPPLAASLAQRYLIHSTLPSLCADELLADRADLGLIPIASLTPELAIVPGCAIASLDYVRSIQLIVKIKDTVVALNLDAFAAANPDAAVLDSAIDPILSSVRTIAADTASRSSLAY